MDLPDRSIKASLARIAEDADEAIDEDDAAEAEEDLGREGRRRLPSPTASLALSACSSSWLSPRIEGDDDDDDDDDESEDPEGDDDDEESEDPGEDMKKKAADDEEMDEEDESMMKKKSALERRMDRIERVLHRLAGDDGESKGDQSKTHIDYANAKDGDKETGHGESAGDQSKSHKDYEGKKAGWQPGHRSEGGWDPGHMESMGDDEEAMLEMMLKEEGMGHDHEAMGEYMDDESMDEESMLEEMMLEEMRHEEGMDQNDPAHFESMGHDHESMDDESMEADVVMMDPMGLGGDEIVEEDDMMILASLFGKEAGDLKDEDKKEKEDHEKGAIADDKDHIEKLEKDEDEDAEDLARDEESKKKAALRPQPKRASTGAKTLGGVSKEAASEVGDLSKLWESAPDVSKFF